MEVQPCYINDLPKELFLNILQYCDCQDILNFGLTCKRHLEIVQNDQNIWKYYFKTRFPEKLFKAADRYNKGDWFNETRKYYIIKQQVYDELCTMSDKYYRRNDLSLPDVKYFFDLALKHNINYCYVIHVLRYVIKVGQQDIEANFGKKPYTLTEMYYAKVALAHLVHAYLTIEWVQAHDKNALDPEFVLNFFVQWVNPEEMHTLQKVEEGLDMIARNVTERLCEAHPVPAVSFEEKRSRNIINDRDVLEAMTHYIYREIGMKLDKAANIFTLDIARAIKYNFGFDISVGTIYSAVARRLGVKCDVVAFPEHFFLEWRDTAQVGQQRFIVDVSNGQLHPKRQCPFALNPQRGNLTYNPQAFMQYVYTVFMAHMSYIKNWTIQNAMYIMEYLNNNPNDTNPYKDFLPYLLDVASSEAMREPIDVFYLSDEHMTIIETLININPDQNRPTQTQIEVKRRQSRLKYAIGMICLHTTFHYVCVIRDWNVPNDLDAVNQQPMPAFYNVVASDQSNRYVSQDNIVPIPHPKRLYNLEDKIAQDFIYFDGFAYVPNAQKRMEYPDDQPIVEMFRTHSERKPPTVAY